MESRGFFFDLADEMENSTNVHRRLIAEIEEISGRNLLCYIANPGHPGGALQDHDPDILENLLRSVDLDCHGRKLDFLVNSPGGFPYAAGKIVRVCRTYSGEFRSIVLGRAMSAATLLCLGADELLMTPTASLGPIDPQMLMGSSQGQRLVPAFVILDSFHNMIVAAQQAIMQGQPPDPFFHILDSIDISAIFESTKALASTEAIAKDLLREGLLKNNPERIESAVKALLAEGEKELHGKHLYANVLRDSVGLPVNPIEENSEYDRKLRELFIRVEVYTGKKGIAKYFVCRAGGIDINIQVRK